MKAAVARAFAQPLEIDDVPTPTPGHGEVLIRVAASGVCHSDVHIVDAEWKARPELPLIPGHEAAGVVAALGEGVTSLAEGDRVGVPWIQKTCGHCNYCIEGAETLCGDQLTTGYMVNGGFAEYIVADADFAAPLPEGVDFCDAAPLLCAGVTTYRGLIETEARPGNWVLISGIGGLGHVAIQYAKAMGLSVAAVDIDEKKLALASELGADVTVNAASDNAVRTIRKQIGGAHAALVTATAMPAFEQAFAMLRPGGTLVAVGLPGGQMSIPLINLTNRRLTVRGTIVGSRKDLREALAFAGAGKVKAHVERQPFEAVNDVLDRLRRGEVEGRVVLEM